jgi:hypothetical protein
MRSCGNCPESPSAQLWLSELEYTFSRGYAKIPYMGHTCVASTYWYLESTPQLMADIARSCEVFLYGGGS